MTINSVTMTIALPSGAIVVYKRACYELLCTMAPSKEGWSCKALLPEATP